MSNLQSAPQTLNPFGSPSESYIRAVMSMDYSGGGEPLSDAELEELALEMPALALLRDFGRQVAEIPWFTELGTPLRGDSKTVGQAYLDALGFPDARPARISNWDDAIIAAESGDWNGGAWEAEEGLRASLSTDLLDVLSEEAFEIGFTYAASEAEPAVRTAAETAANIWGVEDMEIAIAAAGAAMQAVHGAALATAIGADEDHPFLLRLKLFEQGRWPIGVAGLTFNIF